MEAFIRNQNGRALGGLLGSLMNCLLQLNLYRFQKSSWAKSPNKAFRIRFDVVFRRDSPATRFPI